MSVQRIVYSDSSKKLSEVAANAAESARTLTFGVAEVSRLSVAIELSHTSATAITMTGKARLHAGGINGTLTTARAVSGTITVSDATWSYSVAGSATVVFDIDCRTYEDVTLIFGATGGGANDLLSVEAAGGQGE